MALKTLLQVVQDVMSETGYDEVNSIGDTVDADQVANIVRAVYEEIRELSDLPASFTFFQLDATSTSTPTVMTLPDGVQEIKELEYNVQESVSDPDNYKPIPVIPLIEFYRRTNALDDTETNVTTITVAGRTAYKILNDIAPSFCTVYNDKYVLFNAYDSSLETNLQQSKSRCVGFVEDTWSHTDSYQIPLSTQLTRLLIEKSKARVNSSLRQVESPEVSRTARRLEVRAIGTKDRTGSRQIVTPNYGRR